MVGKSKYTVWSAVVYSRSCIPPAMASGWPSKTRRADAMLGKAGFSYPAMLVLFMTNALHCHAYEHASPPAASPGATFVAQLLRDAAASAAVPPPAQLRCAMTTPSVHSCAPLMVIASSFCILKPMQYGKHMLRVESDRHDAVLTPPHMGTTYTATSAARIVSAFRCDARGCDHLSDWTDTRALAHVSDARLHATSTGVVAPATVATKHCNPDAHVHPKSPTSPPAESVRAIPRLASTDHADLTTTVCDATTNTLCVPSVMAYMDGVMRTRTVALVPKSGDEDALINDAALPAGPALRGGANIKT